MGAATGTEQPPKNNSRYGASRTVVDGQLDNRRAA